MGRRLIANRFFFFVMPPFFFRFIRKWQNPHRPAASPPSAKRRCLRLRSAGKNAEVFRCNSQKCTIPGKRHLPAGAVSFSNVLSTIILHYNRLSRSFWLQLLIIPVRVLRRRVSNRFDHTEILRFLLQFLHHSALKTPFISKIKQVLKFIAFFQSESSKRHFIGYPAPLIHIVGIIGTEIAPIPVIHKERMAMVIVKFESGQNRFTQRTKGFLLADLNVPVTASYSTPCLLRYCSSRRMSIRWSRINRCAFGP